MVKDLGSTSFGLLIAYILPGLVALYGLSFWLTPVASLFAGFLTAESTIGLSLLVVLMSIAIGLYVTVVRELIFERVICRTSKLCADDFSGLGSEAKLSAFRAAVDEMYRYHQFWGGIFIVAPLVYVGWLTHTPHSISFVASLSLLIGVEVLSLYAAIESFKRYIFRANLILKGAANAKRMEGTPTSEKGAGPAESEAGKGSPSATPRSAGSTVQAASSLKAPKAT